MVLLLFALVSGAAAQCTCYRDPVKGYWTGATNCANCDFVNAPLDAAAPNQAAVCNIVDSCKDVTRPLAQRVCYAQGTCQTNNATMPCLCPANLAGAFCEKCIDGYVGWPNCLTAACVGPNATSSGTCNGHGSCLSGTQTVACGVQCLNPTRINPGPCSSVSYQPATQQCVGTPTGEAAQIAVVAGGSLCGTRAGGCPFGQTCAAAEYNLCCPKDQVFCQPRRRDLPVICCHASETCCDGACCPSSQSCKDIVRRAFTVTGAMPLDPTSTAIGGGPVTEWMMMDGTEIEPYKECSNDYLGAVATTRVIILPLCLLIAAIVSLILIFKAVGLNPVMVAVPGVLLIILCIFLFFSPYWPTAIVIAFGALFGMGAAHKGGSACILGLAVEFFALAVVTGGLGLGYFFYANNVPTLFFDLTDSRLPSWDTLRQCSGYYDYFSYDATSRPYDADPTLTYRHYCSEGWFAYLGLVADLVVMLQIIMLAATGVAYLGGSGAAKSV